MLNISSAHQTFALRLWGCTYLLLILPFKSADEKSCVNIQTRCFIYQSNTGWPPLPNAANEPPCMKSTGLQHLSRHSPCYPSPMVTLWCHPHVCRFVRPSIRSEVRRQKQDKHTVHRITAYQHSGIILNSSLVFSLGCVLWQVERQLAFLRRCAQLLPHYLHRGIVWQFQVVHARHHWRQVIVWILRRFHCLSHNGQRRIQTAETYKQNQSREKIQAFSCTGL